MMRRVLKGHQASGRADGEVACTGGRAGRRLDLLRRTRSRRMRRLTGVIAFGTGAFIALHELGRRWGATGHEVQGPMAGDDIVSHAPGQTTHAITIGAAAEDVWPGSCRWDITEPAGTRTRGSIATSGTSPIRARPGSSQSSRTCRSTISSRTASPALPSTESRSSRHRTRSCCTQLRTSLSRCGEG
jgi:hypothetical protein